MTTLFHIRALAPFEPGDNATDVIINEVHFNETALDLYHYKLYTNGTLSNDTHCYLAFQHFHPHMDENGTFVNGTSCYAPIHDIGRRASAGLAFTVLFAILIFCTLLNLRKHGRRYLPYDRRWKILGRRLQWIWLLAVAACGLISCIMSIDVDRNWIQGPALTLQSVFYTLLTPLLMAAVWEAVRHWGSWQKRQITDRDPYAFTQGSTRTGQEIILIIIFYLCALFNFFLAVPRSWSSVELQRSPDQTAIRAQPMATDTRFKAAGFVALGGILVICYSLEHSIYRYKPLPTSKLHQAMFYFEAAPSHFLVAITLLGIKIGYTIASAFDWTISPLRYNADPAWLYGLGYTPVVCILLLFNIVGFCELNEDKALVVQRSEIEDALASNVGLLERKRRPSWWKPMSYRKKRRESSRDALERYVELGIINAQDDESKDKGDAPRVTTRTASQASGTTDTGSDAHIEDVIVQPHPAARRDSDDIWSVPQRGRDTFD